MSVQPHYDENCKTESDEWLVLEKTEEMNFKKNCVFVASERQIRRTEKAWPNGTLSHAIGPAAKIVKNGVQKWFKQSS